ncbi:MAG: thymidine phosphorylase [Bacteroidia bacterium]|nr:thymidine phosphorylase [Bacteroidia bacterium]
MLPQEIIRKQRDGELLSCDELEGFFSAFLHGDVADAQMSAFLMACYFSPLNMEQTLAITEHFLRSGTRLDLAAVQGALVDKHSTGGVGDKTSLLVAPIVAAAGVKVPMISGRALGHTGGTLDKLESIPGFSTQLAPVRFMQVLERTGAALAGQSDDLVPLDRVVYALRDVTATVEIPSLIAASIISKKLAGGASALVLDVKTGSGAFIRDEARAFDLAGLLVRVGEHFGLRTCALVSDMDQPLGRAIGNWLEVVEASDCLQGAAVPDLMELTYALSGMMIHLGGKARSIPEGMEVAREMVRSGLAWERFLDIIEAQGGDTSFVRETLRYRNADSMVEVCAPHSGTLRRIDARMLGLLATEIGAGRKRNGDGIDPTAGIVLWKKAGEQVEADEPLCRLYSSSTEALVQYRDRALAAFDVGYGQPAEAPLILALVTPEGIQPWVSHHV